jgi:hypothetical protein
MVGSMSDANETPVDPQDPSLPNSQIIHAVSTPPGVCIWNGAKYSAGSRVVSGGRRYIAHLNGQWSDEGPALTVGNG